MDHDFPILMFIFAGMLLLYAMILAITRDYKMLPYRAQVPVKPKNPKAYTLQLAKIIVLVSLAVAIGAAVALWYQLIGAVVILAGVTAVTWVGTKIVKDSE